MPQSPLCPVCGWDVETPLPEFCGQCGWELQNDISLTLSIDLSDDEIRAYDRKLSVARKVWQDHQTAAEERAALKAALKKADAAAGMKDILETHFGANRDIGRRFGRSLSGMEGGLREKEKSLQTGLSEYDALLKSLHQRIEETAGAIRELQVTG